MEVATGEERNRQSDPPVRKKKKVDMVDSSMADNITARKKVLTVKDMVCLMKGQKISQSVTANKIQKGKHELGGGRPNILTVFDRGENRNNTVNILQKNTFQ